MTIHRNKFSHELSAAEYSAIIVPFTTKKTSLYRAFFKRVLDILFVLAIAPIVLPATLIFAALVARDGYNPFYRQSRIGLDGKVFRMWKLRTMVPNADIKLQHYLDSNLDAKLEWTSKQKLIDDPRITRFGHMLRKTSMDELPQFWNVLIGDMSVVGPRPMMPEQRSLYPGLSYYRLRPGITGFWQISDRNNTSFAARAGYDDHYNKELSLVTDLSVLFSTIGVILRGTGC